jgi:purine-binding chemotaxis protein CheW
MNDTNQFLVFTLEEQRYALYLSAVERIVRMVEITPLPKAPEIVFGVINVQGQVVPVVNVRKRFRLPEREIDLSDQLIIAHSSRRTVALVADAVSGVVERSEKEIITPEKILPGIAYVEGVIKFEDGMILIHDLDKFFSLEEEAGVDNAMKEGEQIED